METRTRGSLKVGRKRSLSRLILRPRVTGGSQRVCTEVAGRYNVVIVNL